MEKARFLIASRVEHDWIGRIAGKFEVRIRQRNARDIKRAAALVENLQGQVSLIAGANFTEITVIGES